MWDLQLKMLGRVPILQEDIKMDNSLEGEIICLLCSILSWLQ